MRKALNQLGAIITVFTLPVVLVAMPWAPEGSPAHWMQSLIVYVVVMSAFYIIIELVVGVDNANR
jgi:hypothetical protein